MNTTQLYRKVIAADEAFKADDTNLEKLRALESIESEYYSAIVALRNRWSETPKGERRDSAEQNAIDTEGCEVDQLRLYEIALMSYDLGG